MKEHYQTLGIDTNATPDDIKKAYRKLAMKHHPDRGGDSEQFRKIQEAYDALTDPNAQKQQAQSAQQPGGFDFDSIFEIFGADLRSSRRGTPRVTIWITLADVIKGGKKTISLQLNYSVSTVEIELPVGLNDGDNIRYAGIGPDGGDLIVQFKVKPDSVWHRDQKNLHCRVAVDIWKLITGTDIYVGDPSGNRYSVTVPPATQPGTHLRLSGKGLPERCLPGRAQSQNRGDLIVEVETKIPMPIDPELLDLIKQKYS